MRAGGAGVCAIANGVEISTQTTGMMKKPCLITGRNFAIRKVVLCIIGIIIAVVRYSGSFLHSDKLIDSIVILQSRYGTGDEYAVVVTVGCPAVNTVDGSFLYDAPHIGYDRLTVSIR